MSMEKRIARLEGRAVAKDRPAAVVERDGRRVTLLHSGRLTDGEAEADAGRPVKVYINIDIDKV